MKHIRVMSRRPAPAQFESILQLIGVINGLLDLLNRLSETFGANFLNKQDPA